MAVPKYFYVNYQERKADIQEKSFEELLGQLHDILRPAQVRGLLCYLDPGKSYVVTDVLPSKNPGAIKRVVALTQQLKKQSDDLSRDDIPQTLEEYKKLILYYMTESQIHTFLKNKKAVEEYGDKQI